VGVNGSSHQVRDALEGMLKETGQHRKGKRAGITSES